MAAFIYIHKEKTLEKLVEEIPILYFRYNHVKIELQKHRFIWKMSFELKKKKYEVVNKYMIDKTANS